MAPFFPWKDEGGAWLQDRLRFISREAAELRPGGETVITRLADILVIQMIRAWIDSAPLAGLVLTSPTAIEGRLKKADPILPLVPTLCVGTYKAKHSRAERGNEG